MWRDCILTYCGVSHVMRALFGVVATSSRTSGVAGDRGSDTGGKGSGAGHIGLGAEVRGHRSALLGLTADLLAEPRLEAQPALMQQHVEPVDAALAARARGRASSRVSSGT